MYLKYSIRNYRLFACLFLLEALLAIGFVVFQEQKKSFFILLTVMLLSVIVLSKFRVGIYLLLILITTCEAQVIVIVADWSNYFLDPIAIYVPILLITLFSFVIFKCSRIKPEDQAQHQESALNYSLFLLIAWSAISLMWASNFFSSILQEVKFITNIALFYMLVYIIKDVVTFRKTVKVIVFCGILIAVGALASLYVDSASLLFDITDRSYFEFNFLTRKGHAMGFMHHNPLGSILNIMIALTLGMLLSTVKRGSKLFYFIALLLFLAALITTRSRTNLIGLFAMLTFFSFTMPSLKDKIFKYAVSFLLIFSTLFILTLPKSFSFGMRRYSTGESGSSISQRFEWWGNASKYTFKQTVGAGMGVGGFKQRFGSAGVPHAHSLYFSFLFDFGIIGFFLFLSMLFLIIKALYSAMRSIRETPQHIMLLACIGGLIAYAIHCLMDGDYNITNTWLLLGLTMGSVNLVNMMNKRSKRRGCEENKITKMGM